MILALIGTTVVALAFDAQDKSMEDILFIIRCLFKHISLPVYINFLFTPGMLTVVFMIHLIRIIPS